MNLIQPNCGVFVPRPVNAVPPRMHLLGRPRYGIEAAIVAAGGVTALAQRLGVHRRVVSRARAHGAGFNLADRCACAVGMTIHALPRFTREAE